jgi:hypothetical protein
VVATLLSMLERTGRHLLSQIDLDPHSATYGCFDRRYWAWKLVDFPEATFQRNAYLLAWLASRESDAAKRSFFERAVDAAFAYSAAIQHRDGSFDQAFPHEHSYGATAFILESLASAASLREQALTERDAGILRKAVAFLRSHREAHGAIANHIAGAAAGMLKAARLLGSADDERAADRLLKGILDTQSSEGWFPEYGGADPGYQTLCVHYLAQYFATKPGVELRGALDRAVEFLSWFVHPDGTFGGEYGSRRTAVYYPGGIALLAPASPAAAALHHAMLRSIEAGTTATLEDVDFGNIAPLAASYAVAAAVPADTASRATLPYEQASAQADFRKAGIAVRGRGSLYVVAGISNGGVVKVFDRRTGAALLDDSGYFAMLEGEGAVSTQVTDLRRAADLSAASIGCTVEFSPLKTIVTTPLRFTILRLLNLTVMRSIVLGNLVKKLLVRMLIGTESSVPLRLRRVITIEDHSVTIDDELTKSGAAAVLRLETGQPFVSIHMASARYFAGHYERSVPVSVPVEELNTTGRTSLRRTVIAEGA